MLLFFDSVNLTIKSKFNLVLCCCCFQTFKDLFGFTKPPFLSGCKSKNLYFTDQNYLKNFQIFSAFKIELRTTVFPNGLQR